MFFFLFFFPFTVVHGHEIREKRHLLNDFQYPSTLSFQNEIRALASFKISVEFF